MKFVGERGMMADACMPADVPFWCADVSLSGNGQRVSTVMTVTLPKNSVARSMLPRLSIPVTQPRLCAGTCKYSPHFQGRTCMAGASMGRAAIGPSRMLHVMAQSVSEASSSPKNMKSGQP